MVKHNCDSPDAWFAMCEIPDKDGNYGKKMGIGKAVADVSYYNLDDEDQTEYTYKMCKYCLSCELLDDGLFNHKLTNVEYY